MSVNSGNIAVLHITIFEPDRRDLRTPRGLPAGPVYAEQE
jgi:hypothetical protein